MADMYANVDHLIGEDGADGESVTTPEPELFDVWVVRRKGRDAKYKTLYETTNVNAAFDRWIGEYRL